MAGDYRRATPTSDERRRLAELRARFAAALSRMYGAEVPAYTTLVDVSTEVNRDCAARRPARLAGAGHRRTPRRDPGRQPPANSPTSPTCSPRSACTRSASTTCARPPPPFPVVSTAFRPIDADELARNPFRVFTSMLATADARFFDADLRARVERFLGARRAVRPRADRRRPHASRPTGGCRADGRRRLRRARGGRVRAVARADRRRLVRRAVAGLRGGRRHRGRAVHPHQPPHPAGARHRRAVPPDDRAGRRDDRRHPGPAALGRARRAVAADVVPRAGRAAPVPRRRRRRHRGQPAGALRRGRGARRRADPQGPGALRRRDGARPDPVADVGRALPRHRRRAGRRRGWPTTAAAIRPNPLSTRTSCPPRRRASSAPTSTPTPPPVDAPTTSPATAPTGWPAPSATTSTTRTTSTRKQQHHDQQPTDHPPHRRRAARPGPRRAEGRRLARSNSASRAAPACRPAPRSPVTSCSPSPRPPPRRPTRPSPTRRRPSPTWRVTPAPVRGALVARLGELLVEHKADLGDAGHHRGGQDHLGGARRGAGDDRHLPVRRRSVAAAVRPHHRLRAAGSPADGDVAPARRRRRHHRVQLPGRGVGVEHRGRAGLR